MSTLLVVALFAAVLHHQVRRVALRWQSEQESAIAYHLDQMLRPLPEPQRQIALDAIAPPLRTFGLIATLNEPSDRPPINEPSLEALDKPVITVRAVSGASQSLIYRLAPAYLGLTVGLLITLLITLQASLYWYLRRPLKRIHGQIRQMGRGPWHIPAERYGVLEFTELAESLAAVGAGLEFRVNQWVSAERRSGYELARRQMQVKMRHLQKQSRNLLAGPLARENLSWGARRKIREFNKLLERMSEDIVPAWTNARRSGAPDERSSRVEPPGGVERHDAPSEPSVVTANKTSRSDQERDHARESNGRISDARRESRR